MIIAKMNKKTEGKLKDRINSDMNLSIFIIVNNKVKN